MLLARAYSHHSLLSAVPKIPDLIANAKSKGYTTIALTDEESGSGLIEFYMACQKQEVKPILGATLKIPNTQKDGNIFGRNKSFSKVAVLAKNEQGYKSLLKLISIARTVQEQPAYHITLENLKQLGESFKCFVVLAGNDHEIMNFLREGKADRARNILEVYVQTLGAENVLVETAVGLNNETHEDIKKINLKLKQICDELGVRYVLSPAPRYLESEDDETFRTVLAIRDNKRIGDVSLTRDFSLPNVDQLKRDYSYLEDALHTEDIENQIDIQIRTDYDSKASEAFFPHFELPEGQTPALRLTYETYIGLLERFSPEGKTREQWREVFTYEKMEELKSFAINLKPDTSKLKGYPSDYWQTKKTIRDYVERLEKELDVIIQKGFPAYFLVFSDIMQFCRRNGIVINTRGSAAGCLVGYLTGINILDPLVYDIPFERFLNPFRPSAPDIDGDFADDRREEVIRYIKEKYGSDKVCQIITFGTMLPRAAVRDVGRALGVSYKKCDRLSKLIPIAPQGRKTTFKWAFETSQELAEVYDKDEESRRIMDIAQKIEGNYRHASSHAAGVIISPTSTTDYAPIQWDSDHQMVICQYDMKIAEKIGLVKMDILGIRNLAILGNAIELAEQRRHQKIDLLNIDLQDEKAFELLAKGRTIGLFQLSGATMTRYLVQLEPTKVQDLMAMVALYRPGPMANIPEYIKRKKNPKLVKYYVPEMSKWMGESYGILVYQDDLLYTVIELAGYDWGEADTFRKGVGKKIQAVLDSQHVRFVEGCQTHAKLSKEKAEEIWELMVPFAAYGFNKAHSSNYGMVAYWTAYMKAEYTAEFMTSLMTAENSNLDKVADAIKECRELGLEVLPPDVNKSYYNFHIESDRTIRYGLSSVKNLGSDVIKFMIREREQNGQYKDMDDFLERMSLCQGFNKRSLEALIWAGCLDEIGQKVVEKVKVAV